jgi:hypothetical protein
MKRFELLLCTYSTINISPQIDSGYIMELDATAVVGRVLMKGADRPEVGIVRSLLF